MQPERAPIRIARILAVLLALTGTSAVAGSAEIAPASVLSASVLPASVLPVSVPPVSAPPVTAPTAPAVIELRPPAAAPKLAIPGEIDSSAPSQIALTKLLSESRCLAEVMYFEARGEGEAGEIAVGEVIMNRLAAGTHGHTICNVVYEGAGQTFCQFTFACDGSLDKPKLAEPWRAAQVLAARLLAGEAPVESEVGGATYYHAVSVTPSWKSRMVRVGQIGNHIFYRLPLLRPSVMDAVFRGSLP
jgi:hypothetical protein